MGLRRTARECALQMLYEFDVGGNTKSEILQTFWQMNEHPEQVGQFANELFEGTIRRLEEIDAIIQQHTKNWRLGRMAVVDRNILRLAVFEFLSGNQTPQTVVINEALEIARKFSMTLDQYQELMMEARGATMDYRVSYDEDVDLLEHSLPELAPDPYELVSAEEIRMNLIEAVEALAQRERLIVTLYYYEGLTFREIGGILRISESRVFQIHTAVLNDLRKKLKDLV